MVVPRLDRRHLCKLICPTRLVDPVARVGHHWPHHLLLAAHLQALLAQNDMFVDRIAETHSEQSIPFFRRTARLKVHRQLVPLWSDQASVAKVNEVTERKRGGVGRTSAKETSVQEKRGMGVGGIASLEVLAVRGRVGVNERAHIASVAREATETVEETSDAKTSANVIAKERNDPETRLNGRIAIRNAAGVKHEAMDSKREERFGNPMEQPHGDLKRSRR